MMKVRRISSGPLKMTYLSMRRGEYFSGPQYEPKHTGHKYERQYHIVAKIASSEPEHSTFRSQPHNFLAILLGEQITSPLFPEGSPIWQDKEPDS